MRWWAIITLGIICIGSCAVQAKTKSHPKSSPARQVAQSRVYDTQGLVAEINRIIQNSGNGFSIGVEVKSMKMGDTLYAKNEQTLFTPASILKVMTAEAALLYLGPEYKFPTTFLTDAPKIMNGTLAGNLYLIQTGDPTLTYIDFNDLMDTLKSQQVQYILGNIYIDTTAYDQTNFGPGWIWDDKQYCYAAPINASIINKNCLSFQVTPGKMPGQLANIVGSPRYYYGAIQNEVITKPPRSRCYLQVNTIPGTALSISGCMPKGKSVWGVSSVIGDILQYNRSLVGSLFKKYGIQVKGHIIAGAAPSNLSPMAIHQSKALHLLINDMLKMSDNIIAGSLFKKMGEFYSKQPGSWQNGSVAVTQILAQKAGVDAAQMNILDGSGLSRDNLVKPAQMMQVLDFAYHNYSTNYEFISALPIAGVDGTLKHRLYNVARKVRAKTGTMSGVVSLAGYAVTRDKEPMAFVIIINGRNGNIWQYREMEDKIVTAITNYSRS